MRYYAAVYGKRNYTWRKFSSTNGFLYSKDTCASGLELKSEADLSQYAPSELLEAADEYVQLQHNLEKEGQLPEPSSDYLTKILPARMKWSRAWRQYATEELVSKCKEV